MAPAQGDRQVSVDELSRCRLGARGNGSDDRTSRSRSSHQLIGEVLPDLGDLGPLTKLPPSSAYRPRSRCEEGHPALWKRKTSGTPFLCLVRPCAAPSGCNRLHVVPCP